MSYNNKASPTDFSDYLQSVVKLDALDKITQQLNAELEDSQRVMNEINLMFNSIPNTQTRNEATNDGFRHEALQYLEAGAPKLLLPDMVENTSNVDIDVLIATMKAHAEELKKNLALTQPQSQTREALKDLSDLNLEQYANSLDQLSKRLANIKLKRDDTGNRNMDLEVKMAQLCQDVTMFTQMVQMKTTLSEFINHSPETQENNALQYDNIINKLLSGINEVSYLLQNKN